MTKRLLAFDTSGFGRWYWRSSSYAKASADTSLRVPRFLRGEAIHFYSFLKGIASLRSQRRPAVVTDKNRKNISCLYNQGFVLATLLILLAALSLLAIHTLNSTLLQNKMSRNFFIGAQRLYDAERILKLAETAVEQQNNLSCYLKSQAANYVLMIKNTQGLPALPRCRVDLGENRAGYYVVQAIQTSPEAEYYRLTGWMEEGILVQSTYVRLQGQPRLTRVSWRLLS